MRRLLAAWIPDISPELAAEFLERDGRGYSDRGALVSWLTERLPPEQRSPDLEARFRGELPLFLQADPAAPQVLADYVVSNDDHLLRLGVVEGVRIVTPGCFVRQHLEPDAGADPLRP